MITRMLEADSTHLHLGIALSYMRLYYNVQLSPRPSNCNDVHRQVRISRKPKTCSKTQLLTNSTSPRVKKSQRWLSKWLFSLAVVDLWGGGLSSVFTRGSGQVHKGRDTTRQAYSLGLNKLYACEQLLSYTYILPVLCTTHVTC